MGDSGEVNTRKRKVPEIFSTVDTRFDRETKLALELSKREAVARKSSRVIPPKKKGGVAIREIIQPPLNLKSSKKPSSSSISNINPTTSSIASDGRRERRFINSGISAPKSSSDNSSSKGSRDERANLGDPNQSGGGYHGVAYANGRWLSHIMYKGQSRILGSFDSSVEAACAHDEMALRLNQGKLTATEDGSDGYRPLNLEPYDGPICRFGYGLVQTQGYLKDGYTLAKLKNESIHHPVLSSLSKVEKEGKSPFWIDELLRGSCS